jgi:hypothetical protein
MHESDITMAVFLATRNIPTVKRERFVERIATTLARQYDHITEHHLLSIRAQVRNEQRN